MGKRTLVFDVETTGLATYDRVVSIAGVWCDGLDLTAQHFYFVFNPKRASHPMAFAAHGLPDWWLRFQPAIAEYIPYLYGQFSSAELVVGHNVSFDLRMLGQEFAKANAAFPNVAYFCTMQAFRQRAPAQPATLEACASVIGLGRTANTHSAFEDTFLAMNLYRYLNGRKDCYALPSPFPMPSNIVAVPERVIWANRIDSTPADQDCPAVPDSVAALLAQVGIDVTGQPPRTVRDLLAAYEFASMVAHKATGKGNPDRLHTLVLALANGEAAESVREWSRWAWGRPNPRVPYDDLRAFAEQVLAGLA